MPAAFNEIGIKCVTAALVESVDVQKQLEHKIIEIARLVRGQRKPPHCLSAGDE